MSDTEDGAPQSMLRYMISLLYDAELGVPVVRLTFDDGRVFQAIASDMRDLSLKLQAAAAASEFRGALFRTLQGLGIELPAIAAVLARLSQEWPGAVPAPTVTLAAPDPAAPSAPSPREPPAFIIHTPPPKGGTHD